MDKVAIITFFVSLIGLLIFDGVKYSQEMKVCHNQGKSFDLCQLENGGL